VLPFSGECPGVISNNSAKLIKQLYKAITLERKSHYLLTVRQQIFFKEQLYRLCKMMFGGGQIHWGLVGTVLLLVNVGGSGGVF